MKQLILRILERLFKNVTFTMRRGVGRGIRRRYGFGFKPRGGRTPEETFLLGVDLAGKTVFDVGGYVGVYATFFARKAGPAGRVCSFEPNPRNFEELTFNTALNGVTNATLLNFGLGDAEGQIEFVVNPAYPARGSADAATREALLKKPGSRAITVEVHRLDDLMSAGRLPKPDFVKIDVEGLEADVLSGFARTLAARQPELFIEIHAPIRPDMAELLTSAGYACRHVESAADIPPEKLTQVAAGHLYCAKKAANSAKRTANRNRG